MAEKFLTTPLEELVKADKVGLCVHHEPTVRKRVILSSPILLETGVFEMKEVSLAEAVAFAQGAENFCGHPTMKILNIELSKDRKVCEGYDEALVLKPKGRLEVFGKEYSREEIEEIGVTCFLISRVG